MATKLHYFLHALRARKHYKRQGYKGNDLPCLSCTWERGWNGTSDTHADDGTPWLWVYCDRCDWGNL